MSDSKQWALQKLTQANTIFEPRDKPWWTQLANFLVWAVECLFIWYLASHLLP